MELQSIKAELSFEFPIATLPKEKLLGFEDYLAAQIGQELRRKGLILFQINRANGTTITATSFAPKRDFLEAIKRALNNERKKHAGKQKIQSK